MTWVHHRAPAEGPPVESRLMRRALSSPPVMGALFGGTSAALVLAALIFFFALTRWLRGHAVSEADWLVAADAGLIVLAIAAVVRLVSLKRGCLVLGRTACACAIVFYNLVIKPGNRVDEVTGIGVMLACLASYAALGTRFAKAVLVVCSSADADAET